MDLLLSLCRDRKAPLEAFQYFSDYHRRGGQGIDERATIKVTRAGETMPVFCGWFDGIRRPSFKSGKPQEYHCLGHSAILYHRFPHLRAYTSNDVISNIFGDTVASLGIIFQASSLMPPNWQDASWMRAPAGTYSAPYYTGTDFSQRIPMPTPAVYLGTTLLTQAASLTGMAVNQWFRDAVYLYVRTGVADPTRCSASTVSRPRKRRRGCRERRGCWRHTCEVALETAGKAGRDLGR